MHHVTTAGLVALAATVGTGLGWMTQAIRFRWFAAAAVAAFAVLWLHL